MKTIYENEKYAVEVHPFAGCPYWVIDKSEVNPLHPVATYYDEERAIACANGEMGEIK